MKRKHCEEAHIVETGEEWLSTRNKQKIKLPSPKFKRRKSSVYKGFVKQSSSSLWQLSRDEPPHPLLSTATKQTKIQGFFNAKTTEDKETHRQQKDGGDTTPHKLSDGSPVGSQPHQSVTLTCVDSDWESQKENVDRLSSSRSSSELARPGPREATLENLLVSNQGHGGQTKEQGQKVCPHSATVLKPSKSEPEREETYENEKFTSSKEICELSDKNLKDSVRSTDRRYSTSSDNSLTFSEDENDETILQKLRDTQKQVEFSPLEKDAFTCHDNSLTFTQSNQMCDQRSTENSQILKFGDVKHCKTDDHEINFEDVSWKLGETNTSFKAKKEGIVGVSNHELCCDFKSTDFIAKHLYDDSRKIRAASISQPQRNRCGHCPLFDVKDKQDQYQTTRRLGRPRPVALRTLTCLRRSSAPTPPGGDTDPEEQPSLISARRNNLGQLLHNMSTPAERRDKKCEKLLTRGKKWINVGKQLDCSGESLSDMSPLGVSDTDSLQFTDTTAVNDDSYSSDSDVFTLGTQIS